ncbi:MAG: PBP1A family penicillin-binding protein [Candidatus Magasanikbacteria bacterium]|nr:PBP1A family penicillin-binding protein [Candidatus Magasanikbacteria bacterium]
MPISNLQKRSYGYVHNKQQKSKSPKRTRGAVTRLTKKYNLTRVFLLGTLGIFVLGFLMITVLFAWASKDLPDPDKLTDRTVAQSTKIYDRSGEHVLYEIYADERRTIVELEEIPQALIDGLIATEDKVFYEHKGIRPLSIIRSVITGIFTSKRVGSGASTLTQQLVKNAILSAERSYIRKLKEVILTIRLEQKYTKDQILKIYFNEIPYGSTNYGVESASQNYFGKHVSDLTLAESATLAGFPKAPSKYLNDPEALKFRRDFVLLRMQEEGYITEDEKNLAQAEPLTIKQRYDNIEAPHFVVDVREELEKKYGNAFVQTGGLKVITTLDWDKQQIADEVIKESGESLDKAQANNVALVSIDPKTGQILAMIGSRNFWNDEIGGQFNVARKGIRQPGSSFKPIIYLAAFEKGYTPNTILFDVITNFSSGKPYIPKNYDSKERGPLTIRTALQGSLNIPAVKVLYLIGEKQGVEFAKRFGYSTLDDDDFGLSLVLGGGEVKLIDHTNTYATFANNGLQFKPVSILKVEDASGKVLEEWKKENGNQVIDSNFVATLSNVLSDDASRAYMFGAGGVLTLPGRPVAAKTGTTNNYVDAWTMGYTPSLVTGVWVGNSDNTPMSAGGTMVAAPIWNKFMKRALEGTPVEYFPTPPENKSTKPILNGTTEGTIKLSINKMTGKIATSSTPAQYIEEKTYLQPHSILYYVQKNDPTGDPPEHPENDPQYQAWEQGIQDWITRKKEAEPEWNVSFEEPPNEYDDAYSVELLPTLEISNPYDGQVISSRQINTSITVSAPRGVTKVIYQLDGVYIGVVTEHPFNLNYYAENLEPGEHILKISAYDDVGNKMEKEIKLILDADPIPAGVLFANDYSKLPYNAFPKTIVLKHHKLNEIEKVELYIEKNGTKQLVAGTEDFSNLFNNQILLTWSQAPEKGTYTLIVEVVLQGEGSKVTDQVVTVIE